LPRFSKKIEAIYPVVLGFAFGFAYFKMAPPLLSANFGDLLSPMIDVSAIVIGFLGTIWSILLALNNSEGVKVLKSLNLEQLLFTYILHAIWAFGFLAVWSCAMVLLKPEGHVPLTVSFWFGLCAYAFLAALRVLRIFSRVITFPKS
jgi:hypothetical protein